MGPEGVLRAPRVQRLLRQGGGWFPASLQRANRECVFAVSNELNAIFKNDVGRVCLIFRMLLRLSPAVSKRKETAKCIEASPERWGLVPASGRMTPSSFLIPTSIF